MLRHVLLPDCHSSTIATLCCPQELVQALGHAADAGADIIVAAAAKRAGEVSTAGRGSPLSLAADHTLATIVACLSDQKVSLRTLHDHCGSAMIMQGGRNKKTGGIVSADLGKRAPVLVAGCHSAPWLCYPQECKCSCQGGCTP